VNTVKINQSSKVVKLPDIRPQGLSLQLEILFRRTNKMLDRFEHLENALIELREALGILSEVDGALARKQGELSGSLEELKWVHTDLLELIEK